MQQGRPGRHKAHREALAVVENFSPRKKNLGRSQKGREDGLSQCELDGVKDSLSSAVLGQDCSPDHCPVMGRKVWQEVGLLRGIVTECAV